MDAALDVIFDHKDHAVLNAAEIVTDGNLFSNFKIFKFNELVVGLGIVSKVDKVKIHTSSLNFISDFLFSLEHVTVPNHD